MSDTQRDREERQHVIEVLKSWDGYFIGYTSDEVQEALRYAIASIKTDLRYDLLYEETSGQADKPTTKNDLGVDVPDNNVGNIDCISRAQTQTEIEMNAYRYTLAKERGGAGEVEWNSHLIDINDAVDIIRNLPSVTPQKSKSEWEHDHEILKAYSDGANEMLDNIRAEIEAKCCITVGRENDGAITLHDVFEVIDKYKAE